MESILLLFREKDDSDELTFESCKVCSGHTNRDPVSLTIWLEFRHFFLGVHLNDSRSFIDKGGFIKSFFAGLIVLHDISFFDNWNWLSSECAFIDESTSFYDNTFEGYFDGIFEEDNVSGYNLDWGDLFDWATSEDINVDFVVGHLVDFDVESK